MKYRKILLSLTILIGCFFIGNIDVSATTYQVCTYTGDQITRNQKGYITTENMSGSSFDTKFQLLYKDGNLISFTPIVDGLTTSNQLKFDSGAKLLKDLGVLLNLDNGKCWNNFSLYGYLGYDNGYKVWYANDVTSASYKLITYESPKFEGEKDLTCEYTYNDNKELGKLGQKFREGNSITNIKVVFHFDNLFAPTLTTSANNNYVGKYSYFQDFFTNRNDEVSLHGKLLQQGINSVVTQEQVLTRTFKNRECPDLLISNEINVTKFKVEKFGLTTDKGVQGFGYYLTYRGKADFIDMQSKGTLIKYDMDEIFFFEGHHLSTFCPDEVKSSQNILNKIKTTANKTLNDIKAEKKTLTQEEFNEYNNTLSGLTNDINILKNSMSRFIGVEDKESDVEDKESKPECWDADGAANLRKEYIKLKKKIETTIPDKLNEMVKKSVKLNDNQKSSASKAISELKKKLKDSFKSLDLWSGQDEKDCNGIFGSEDDEDSLINLIQTIFNYFKIIAPILVILFGGLDFGKAVLSSDQDELKKAQSRFVKRCIAAVALFLLPTIIDLVLRWINTNPDFDPTCGIK